MKPQPKLQTTQVVTVDRSKNPPVIKVFKRRRCRNCNALFMPAREDQVFCKETKEKHCRKDFHRYGASYGPLRSGLHRAIDKKYAELRTEMLARNRATIEDTSDLVNQLRDGLGTMDKRLSQMAVQLFAAGCRIQKLEESLSANAIAGGAKTEADKSAKEKLSR